MNEQYQQQPQVSQPEQYMPQQPQQPEQNQYQVDLNFQPVTPQTPYPMSDGDRNLRLAAFIFMVIGLISTCWAIIPLAWTIPMTVISWGIYKGTRPNTTAFGVCSLIFVSLIAGILLLISTKEK